jgi:hypothetical protein
MLHNRLLLSSNCCRRALSVTGSSALPKGLFNKIVHNVSHEPVKSLMSVMIVEVTQISVFYKLMAFSGVTVSATFALAFGLSRLVRRPRLPLDLITAGIIPALFPALKRIQIAKSSISAIPGANLEDESRKNTMFVKYFWRPFQFVVDRYG